MKKVWLIKSLAAVGPSLRRGCPPQHHPRAEASSGAVSGVPGRPVLWPLSLSALGAQSQRTPGSQRVRKPPSSCPYTTRLRCPSDKCPKSARSPRRFYLTGWHSELVSSLDGIWTHCSLVESCPPHLSTMQFQCLSPWCVLPAPQPDPAGLPAVGTTPS